MSDIIEFGKILFKFFTSISDLTSDAINSFDFLGHNATSTIVNLYKDPSKNATNLEVPYRIDQTWGVLSMFFIFLPGIALGISTAIEGMVRKNIRNIFFGLLIIPSFPLALVSIHLWTVIKFIKKVYRRNSNKGEKDDPGSNVLVTNFVGAEAYFESFPQLVLQIYTILNGYQVTTTQLVSIGFSFLSLANTAVTTDLENSCNILDTKISFKETIIELIQRMPCYLTTIIFRIGSFSLSISFLRGYSIICIFILLIEKATLTTLSHIWQKSHDDQVTLDVLDLIYSGLKTIAIPNFVVGEDQNLDKMIWIRYTSYIISFFHHSAILIVIMGLGSSDPEFLDHWGTADFLIKPTNSNFYWIFGTTLLMGCYSLNLILLRAKQMAGLKNGIVEKMDKLER